MTTQQRPAAAAYAPAPTLDAQRACANCGAAAPLAYCPACGQPQHDLHRSLRSLVGELLDNLAGWDGKIPVTLWLLVRYPGRLTAEFLAGRRVRYLPPLRLYLSLSVVFFLVLRAAPSRSSGGLNIRINFGDDTLHVGGATEGVRADSVRRAGAERAAARRDGARSARDAAAPAVETWVDRWYTERKRALAAMPKEERMRRWRDELQGSLLPNMVFVLLPVFALLVKLLYRRAPVFYAEHLVFALHVHAFFMLAMTAARVAPASEAPLVAVAWMAVYVFVALRRVYGGSRPRTLAKIAGLLGAYGVVLAAAVSAAAVLALALAA